jgi:PIN domain nuclease of toxin-antitoxin system
MSWAMAQSSEALLLLDTHIWVWEVFATGQLSRSTRGKIAAASQSGKLRLSMISVWEISMLTTRRRLHLHQPLSQWITEAQTRSRIVLEPLSPEIAMEAGALPGGFRSDPADLMIVATARVTGALLMTCDRRILAYAKTGNVNAFAA